MRTFAISFVLATAVLTPASAQDLFIYPAQGQSQQQLNQDRFECHNWAVGQTGFDPTRAQAAAVPAPQQGGQVLRGGARGAAAGAIGGAIAGDAGKGAAIGAAVGGFAGLLRRRDQRVQQQQVQATTQQQSTAQQGSYNRALTGCLQAKGYSVS